MDWSGKKVVIVGAARQGTALARYLVDHGARVVLTDQRSADQLQAAIASLAGAPVIWSLGGHPQDLLDGASLVCPSGGVPLTMPLIQAAMERSIPLSNDSQIFLEAAPCPTIGITGSAGKTTTTTLVGRMALAAVELSQPADEFRPRRAFVGGNIGNPLITWVDEMQPGDLAVMELSSFQLELMTRSPQVGAILNITPNHLDRHGTMQAYAAAKARILAFQSASDVAVLGRDDPGAWAQAGQAAGRLLSFGTSELPAGQEGTYLQGEELFLRTHSGDTRLFSRGEILLRGEHNLLNVLAACAIAAAAGLPVEAMQAGVSGFTGVAHRLEFVREWRGAAWYNDSIATAPERSMAALRAFDEPLVLLAGGRDKNLPWKDFGALVRQRVDHLVAFGEAAGKVLAAVGVPGPGERPYTISSCSGLKEAVQAAAEIVEPGDVVLLSPGGTSFDEFNDFEERGQCFARWVKELS